MATYVASYHSVTSGLPLAIAIAIHNVPEGLAVRYLVITPSRHAALLTLTPTLTLTLALLSGKAHLVEARREDVLRSMVLPAAGGDG